MGSNDVTFVVDLNNLSKSITQWKHLEVAYQKGLDKGFEELAEKIKEKVMENLAKYGLGGSPMMNSVHVVDTGSGLSVTVGSDYAMFVEYGTGVVGRDSKPHPHLKTGWVYNSKGHGDRGWYYPTTSDDPNPWKHFYGGQLYGWTKGEMARPFMYDSWKWARASYTQILGKNIRAETRKVGGVR